jgi:hypothetical protein
MASYQAYLGNDNNNITNINLIININVHDINTTDTNAYFINNNATNTNILLDFARPLGEAIVDWARPSIIIIIITIIMILLSSHHHTTIIILSYYYYHTILLSPSLL